jgi:hypothetical protein
MEMAVRANPKNVSSIRHKIFLGEEIWVGFVHHRRGYGPMLGGMVEKNGRQRQGLMTSSKTNFGSLE